MGASISMPRPYRIFLCLFGLLAACAPQDVSVYSPQMTTAAPVYDYPIHNPYAATIIGVPPKADQPARILAEPEEKRLPVFKNRAIPEGFWYEHDLRYAQLLQKHAAPVIYVIAGTGGDSHSIQMRFLGDTLYKAGFHVVLLPSPTHQNFIINASHNAIANRPEQSASDMLRVMRMVDYRISREAVVTDRMAMGYSLGALDAAFAALLDQRQHALNFRRVLLVNPPYSVNKSMAKIDAMLYRGLPGGIDQADSFIEEQINKLSSLGRGNDPLNFSSERLLVKAYDSYKPDDETLAAVVGLAFRITAASMTFASDVMSHQGYIFPKNQEFTTSTDLTSYMSLALRTSLTTYFRDIYLPQSMRSHPEQAKELATAESGLASIADQIAGNPKFGLITNRDDIILSPGELAAMQRLFPQQKIFPNGGHLGNLTHPAVSYEIVRFLKTGAL